VPSAPIQRKISARAAMGFIARKSAASATPYSN